MLVPGNLTRTIWSEDAIAGWIGSWTQEEKRLVGYWLGREHWGKGVATRALTAFLGVETTRPLHAWVAQHNRASIRVLEKCGFHAVAQQEHEDGVVEVLLKLDPSEREVPASSV